MEALILPCIQGGVALRKLVSFVGISLDGYAQGPDRWDIGWIPYDQEHIDYSDSVIDGTGSPVYGRITYEGMQYWRTVFDNPESTEHDIQHATWLENVQKIVVSGSLQSTDWKNTTIINDHAAEEIAKLKQMPGKDLVIFGSPTLTRYLMQHDLVDEFRISICPIVLGGGIPLFHQIRERMKLELLDSRTFQSGVVVLHYRVSR